jgi:adenylosuccinate synthase
MFREQIARHTDELNRYGQDLSQLNALCDEWKQCLDEIETYQRSDTEFFLNKALDRGEAVLAEGAQGTLLDLEFGSYPFVTSSHTTVAGVCSGLGVAPQRIGKVLGIFKAYCTRVGSGPFPTELNNETGEFLRQTGHEFGATTGRPRRCGWIDLPALRYAIMLNGVTDLIMTKADVLSGLSEIGVCTHYRTSGGQTPYFPSDLDGVEPIFKMIPGWNEPITGFTSEDALPAQLLRYIDLLEDELERPIRIVSVGPDRRQTIHRG